MRLEQMVRVLQLAAAHVADEDDVMAVREYAMYIDRACGGQPMISLFEGDDMMTALDAADFFLALLGALLEAPKDEEG